MILTVTMEVENGNSRSGAGSDGAMYLFEVIVRTQGTSNFPGCFGIRLLPVRTEAKLKRVFVTEAMSFAICASPTPPSQQGGAGS